MKPKNFLRLLLAICFWLPFFASAQEQNGLRVMVQKTTLSRDDENRSFSSADTIDRTIGLKINIKNTSMKDMPDGTLEHFMVISRWGYSPMRYESFTGSEKVAALKPQGSTDLVVGGAQIGGYKNYSKRYQDKVEAWKIIIKQGSAEVATFQSSSSFGKMYEKAAKEAGKH